MRRRPPRSTQGVSSAASDVYKRQGKIEQLQKNNGDCNMPDNEINETDFVESMPLTNSSKCLNDKEHSFHSQHNLFSSQFKGPSSRISEPLPKLNFAKLTRKDEARLEEIRKKILQEDKKWEEIISNQQIPLSLPAYSKLSHFIHIGTIIEKCTICSDNIKEGEDIIGLPCSHYFHSTCITSYISMCNNCLLYTSPSPRDLSTSRMPSSA
eukprot:TRINITY_DN17313_c0_g1_i1.p1 TRINITY_DN17313_c0_g1~~TRINITY_DN17313_c0_g1_i1.p1  ORF type:complete len:210 (-),score=64.60 TRINITY_DN17313_c0_g1_i1:55-684(-)